MISTIGSSSASNTSALVEKNSIQTRYIKGSWSFQDAAYTKISALGKMVNILEKLKDSLKDIKIDSLNIMTAKVSDEGVVSAVSYSAASEGIHPVKVGAVAKPHILVSRAYRSENDVVGTGTLAVKIADNVGVTVDITESRKTLARIKEVLDAANAGVKARLVKEGGEYRLVLSAKESGETNKINIVVSDSDLNSTDAKGLSVLSYDKNGVQNMKEDTGAKDAAFFADNSFFNSASNKITDAMTGITFTLLKENEGYPVDITVSKDSSSFVFKKLDAFVSAYNDTIKLIDEAQGSTGALKGDASIGYLKNTLIDIRTKTYNNSSLKSLGITVTAKGNMSLDIGKMDDAMQSNLAGVTASINVLSSELEKTVDDYLNSLIPNQQDNYRSIINAYVKAEIQDQQQLTVPRSRGIFGLYNPLLK